MKHDPYPDYMAERAAENYDLRYDRTPQPEHYSVGLEANDEQWFPGRCSCGVDLGMFPTAEDAADALMDHAFSAGGAALQATLHEAEARDGSGRGVDEAETA